MKHTILVLRDIKANYFLPPMFAPNIGVALRNLTDAINSNEKQMDWQKHPEDFELYQWGEWDSDNCHFDTPHDGSHTEPKQLYLLSALKA